MSELTRKLFNQCERGIFDGRNDLARVWGNKLSPAELDWITSECVRLGLWDGESFLLIG